MLGLRSLCIGAALVLRWYCTGNALVLHRLTGATLVRHSYCNDNVQLIRSYLNYIETRLVLHWSAMVCTVWLPFWDIPFIIC